MNRLDRLAQHWAPTAAILGGLAWIVYTVAALLQPWGSYTTYFAPQSTAAVSNLPAFLLIALTGGLALFLLGWALAGAARRIRLPARLPGQLGVTLALVGGAAGLVMWVGALQVQPALATAAMNAGALMLAVGVLLVAIDSVGHKLTIPLFLVAALGMAAIFVTALASLVAWMLPVYAALVMAVYGFAWVRFGDLLGRGR